MRILGFSVPLFVIIVAVYVIGAKYPGLYNKVRGAV